MSGIVSDNVNRSSGLIKSSGGAAGKVLQIVQGTSATQLQSTSASYVDVTGIEVAITLSASDSKVLVMAQTGGACPGSSIDNSFTIDRDGTTLSAAIGFVNPLSANGNFQFPVQMYFLDSPESTSELTYTMQAKTSSEGEEVFGNYTTCTGTIICMEIAA